ncbi:MAG: hypothetical protein ACXW30_01090 [Micavibrio sp.]
MGVACLHGIRYACQTRNQTRHQTQNSDYFHDLKTRNAKPIEVHDDYPLRGSSVQPPCGLRRETGERLPAAGRGK